MTEENQQSDKPIKENSQIKGITTKNDVLPILSEDNIENQIFTKVNSVRISIVEQVRVAILQLLEKYETKDKVGALVGTSGQYLSMLLNYKYFPKKAENQLRLLKKLEKVLNQEKSSDF